MSAIRVLIVEDQPLIAEDIRDYLTNVDYQVEAVLHNLEDTLAVLPALEPDIALLDINLGDNMDGFKVAEAINERYHFPFIYLTSYASKAVVEQAKYTRPMGYIVKPFDEADLYTAIEIALFNHAQLNRPKSLSREAINKRINGELTPKEFEILQDIYEGRTNKQMSAKHYVSVNTVKTHIQNIYDKLDVHNRSASIVRVRSMLQADQ